MFCQSSLHGGTCTGGTGKCFLGWQANEPVAEWTLELPVDVQEKNMPCRTAWWHRTSCTRAWDNFFRSDLGSGNNWGRYVHSWSSQTEGQQTLSVSDAKTVILLGDALSVPWMRLDLGMHGFVARSPSNGVDSSKVMLTCRISSWIPWFLCSKLLSPSCQHSVTRLAGFCLVGSPILSANRGTSRHALWKLAQLLDKVLSVSAFWHLLQAIIALFFIVFKPFPFISGVFPLTLMRHCPCWCLWPRPPPRLHPCPRVGASACCIISATSAVLTCSAFREATGDGVGTQCRCIHCCPGAEGCLVLSSVYSILGSKVNLLWMSYLCDWVNAFLGFSPLNLTSSFGRFSHLVQWCTCGGLWQCHWLAPPLVL